MRVEFEDEAERYRLPHYWKGLAFDRYDGRQWSKPSAIEAKPDNERWTVSSAATTSTNRPNRSADHLSGTYGSTRSFGLNSIREIEIPRPDGLDLPGEYRVVTRDAESDVYYEQRDDIAFRYIVHSQRERYPEPLWNEPMTSYRAKFSLYGMHDYGRYLQLPDDLSPRVRALAQKIAGEAVTVRDVVQSIESHLKANYGYTLDLKREPNLSPLKIFYSNRGGIASTLRQPW